MTTPTQKATQSRTGGIEGNSAELQPAAAEEPAAAAGGAKATQYSKVQPAATPSPIWKGAPPHNRDRVHIATTSDQKKWKSEAVAEQALASTVDEQLGSLSREQQMRIVQERLARLNAEEAVASGARHAPAAAHGEEAPQTAASSVASRVPSRTEQAAVAAQLHAGSRAGGTRGRVLGVGSASDSR